MLSYVIEVAIVPLIQSISSASAKAPPSGEIALPNRIVLFGSVSIVVLLIALVVILDSAIYFFKFSDTFADNSLHSR